MKFVEGGNVPATKEDIRQLQATIVASVEVCTILINQTLMHKAMSMENTHEFQGIMQHLIEKFRDELLNGAQNP